MARVLSQTLIYRTAHSSVLPTRALISSKHRHTLSEGTLIEIDLDSASESSSDSSTGIWIVKLDELMHKIIVQRSAPSWLPFVPGSSYWVPPKPTPKKVANLLKKCSFGVPALTGDETMSLTTMRGWPCADHLLQDNELNSPSNIKVKDSTSDATEVQVEVVRTESRNSDDENK